MSKKIFNSIDDIKKWLNENPDKYLECDNGYDLFLYNGVYWKSSRYVDVDIVIDIDELDPKTIIIPEDFK